MKVTVQTRRDQISAKAIELLKQNPNGLRWSDLIRRLQSEFPQISQNTIQGSTWDLDARFPNEVYKPARGLWSHTSYKLPQAGHVVVPGHVVVLTHPTAKVKEEDFYQPVADYLRGELEECTKAIPLGGKKFQDKWGTPDVIGVLEPRRSDIIKLPTEIVTAEIKFDTSELVTSFGQACAYTCFSHKTYLVIPIESDKKDIDKLDALCNIFGIGLILYDNTSPHNPNFEIRVRAAKHEPDMFYVNYYMKYVEKELFS
jgi:hypothetical protein